MSKLITQKYHDSFTKEEQRILKISLIVLLALTSVLFLQKLIQFGSSPDYEPLKSILFNTVIVVPFIICVVVALKLPVLDYRPVKLQNVITLIGIGGLIFVGYIAITNIILYLLNLSSTLISGNFFWKYFTGIVQVHLTLYLFVQFYSYKTSKKISQPKTFFIEVSKGSTTYSIKVSDIRWVESYDHYVKLHTSEATYLRRDTMKSILGKLGNDFIRIHRKYIINQNFVTRTERKSSKVYLLIDEKKLKVSDSYLDKIEKLMIANP